VEQRCPGCGNRLEATAPLLSAVDCTRKRKCVVCHRTLAARQAAHKTCDGAQCRERYLQQTIREAAERELQEYRRQADEIRKQMTDRDGAPVPASVPLAILPSNDLPLVRLPEERKGALREHLGAIIAEAFAEAGDGAGGERGASEGMPVESPVVEAALIGACALCRGRCCQDGGNQAYLTAGTIRRYIAAHPEQDGEAVLAEYLAYVPEVSYEGSCIYHSESGCALPREMRSEISLEFLCEGVRRMRRELVGGANRVFAAATESGAIERAGIIDREGLRLWQGEADRPDVHSSGAGDAGKDASCGPGSA
jgi:hypothetical protein